MEADTLIFLGALLLIIGVAFAVPSVWNPKDPQGRALCDVRGTVKLEGNVFGPVIVEFGSITNEKAGLFSVVGNQPLCILGFCSLDNVRATISPDNQAFSLGSTEVEPVFAVEKEFLFSGVTQGAKVIEVKAVEDSVVQGSAKIDHEVKC